MLMGLFIDDYPSKTDVKSRRSGMLKCLIAIRDWQKQIYMTQKISYKVFMLSFMLMYLDSNIKYELVTETWQV